MLDEWSRRRGEKDPLEEELKSNVELKRLGYAWTGRDLKLQRGRSTLIVKPTVVEHLGRGTPAVMFSPAIWLLDWPRDKRMPGTIKVLVKNGKIDWGKIIHQTKIVLQELDIRPEDQKEKENKRDYGLSETPPLVDREKVRSRKDSKRGRVVSKIIEQGK